MTARKKVELLAPAGNREKLEIAIHYGADAVYLGGQDFSLRSFADNFTLDELRDAIGYAHAHRVKIYVACNIYPRNDEQEAIKLVNRSEYGLANSVWSSDLERANRVAELLIAGSSWINAHNIFPHGVPYAGCNLSGIGGGVLGPETFFDYLRPQSIVRPAE